MLNEFQINEIREHLEKAQNPLFFFDNDVDGLSSFLLLARYLGRGKGIAIKSFPSLDKNYIRKIHELKPDYIFVLDKPRVSQEFIDEVKSLNLPLIWIDHHDIDITEDISYVNYYNVSKSKEKSSEPVSYWCFKITNKKDDLWIAMMGCISDGYLPTFSKDFQEKYPDLWKEKIKKAFEGLYETQIGKATRILNFAIKDSTSNVVKMIRILLKTNSPYDILQEENNFMYIRYRQINKIYQKLMEKTKNFTKNKIIYFQYSGAFSLSADIANEIYHNNEDKFIIVAFIKGAKANISIRGKNAKKITEEAVKEFENATGGGHEVATGATLNVGDLPQFREVIKKLVEKYN